MRVRWIGKILPPSDGIVNATNDFLQSHIDKMSLDGLDVCRMHDRDHPIGKVEKTYKGKDGSLYGEGFFNIDDTFGDTVYNFDIKTGKLPDLSLSHGTLAVNGINESCILKVPLELSVVDKGHRPGCFYFCYKEEKMETEQKNVPSAIPPATPIPAAASTSAPPQIPSTSELLTPESISKVPPAEILKAFAAMQAKLDEQQKGLIELDSYKKKTEQEKANEEERIKKENESLKKKFHEYIISTGTKEEAEDFGNQFNKMFEGKSLDQLQKENKVFSVISSNFSQLSKKLQQNEEELKR